LTGGEASAISTIAFDDAYAANGNFFDPATFYQATEGVTFSTSHYVWGGVGNGDPGYWDLFGTNGSAFLGVNQSTLSSSTINFDNSVSDLSFDVGVSYGSNIDFSVTGLLNGSTVETQTFSITDNNNGNGTWSTVNFVSEVDSVLVQKSGGNGSAYGIDNYNFTATSAAVPFEFSPTLGLLLVGSLLGGNRLYRQHKASKIVLSGEE
jgi:hypothetical protein